ncbi:MAG: AbrB family transcriptional regulator [Promethearchaeota archaeon Loki_b31]|nr:MAG: AbrB family transcriptional regulator [Candidatus Lokiarchaeota archaeon Loki_b31]
MTEVAKGKYFYGSVKVGERGQIVIPIEARKHFNINPGDQVLIFGDSKKGIAIAKASLLKKFAGKLLDIFGPEEIESNEKQ